VATWTFEQGTGSNTSNVVAFPSNVKSGTLLIAVAQGEGTSALSTPTDSRSNTWTLIRQVNDATANQCLAWWYAISNGAGACTVTHPNLPDFECYIVAEYSVDSGTISIDDNAGTKIENGQAANHTTASNNTTSGSFTTQGADRLIVGVTAENTAAVTFTAGTNYTTRVTTSLSNTGGAAPMTMESKALASAGAAAATWTANASGRSINVGAAFKATGGGVTEQFLAAALDISPAIASALTREAFLASSSDISPSIATALIREAFLASASDISPSISTALTREQFFVVTDAIGLAISTSISATEEQFLSASLDVSPAVSTALIQEQFLASAFQIALTIDDSLTREAFLSAALSISPQIDTNITGGTGVSLHNLLTLGVG
jgi:hypothetical protein